MPLTYRYVRQRIRRPALLLGGRMDRPKPLIDVGLLGPAGNVAVQALLDTGADDTVFPAALASVLGIDLTNALEAESVGIGGSIIRWRVAPVTLRLATNTARAEWAALVAFTTGPLSTPLLGFAGCLQYFTATFFGDREEVELTPNALLPLP